MADALLDLGAAPGIDAFNGSLPVKASYPGAAYRTGVGHDKQGLFPGTGRWDNFHHLGNHVPCPCDQCRITDADIFSFNLIGIVQGSPGNCYTADVRRRKFSHRGQGSGSTHLDRNIQYFAGFFHGRKFIGNGPSGTFNLLPQGLLD